MYIRRSCFSFAVGSVDVDTFTADDRHQFARIESSRRGRLTLLYSPLAIGFQDFIPQRRLDVEADVPFVRSPVKLNSLP